MDTEMELITDNNTSMDPLLATTATPDESVDTTDRAPASNTTIKNLVLPVVTNINEVLPNDKMKTDVQTSTSKLNDIQNLKRGETFLQNNVLKCEALLPNLNKIVEALPNLAKTVSFIEEEFPDLNEAIEDEDINLVDLIMKNRCVNQSSVLVATIKRDKVNLLKSLLPDIQNVASISESGESLLHVATNLGAVLCCQHLLSEGADVDMKSNGYTPLHKAAENKDEQMVKLLISRDADLSLKNPDGFFEQRLDSGINLDGSSNITIDFNKIGRNIFESEKESNVFLQEIANSPNKCLLKHPLMESFLHIKWNRYKYHHFFTSIVTHFLFSVIYTFNAIFWYTIRCPASSKTEDANETWNVVSIVNCTEGPSIDNFTSLIIPWSDLFTAFCTIVYFFKKLVQFIINPKIRVKSFEFYLDLFIILTVCGPWISQIYMVSMYGIDFGILRFEFHLAACGVLAVWIEMMLHVGRLPRFGKYVHMFGTVLWSLVNLGAAFISLIIGFGCSFYILFQKAPAFDIKNFPAAFVKVIVMMLGELEYDDLYYNQNQHFNWTMNNRTDIEQDIEKQLFPVTAHIVLLAFVLLISIVLMNLLVGLAVNDIQKLTEDGKLYRIVQQVELINDLNLLCAKCCKCSKVPANKFLTVNLFGNNDLLKESLKENLHALCLKRESKTKKDLENKERSEILDLLRNLSKNTEGKDKSLQNEQPNFQHSRGC